MNWRNLRDSLWCSLNRIVITANAGMAPNQIDGTLAGRPFYFRARSGHWALTVANKGQDAVEAMLDGTGVFESSGELAGAGWWDEEGAKQVLLWIAVPKLTWVKPCPC